MATALVVLAAGKGTRMKSDLPKVLHPIGGAPLVVHALKSGAAVSPRRQIVVTGHGAKAVSDAVTAWDRSISVVHQAEQLGTAHAVLQAKDALADFDGITFVLFGDTPFVSAETFKRMEAACAEDDVVVLGFEAADPARYGRLVTNGDALDRVVEYKDATDEERAITLCNSGIVAADTKLLFRLLSQVDNNNASGEYYLPDVVEIARSEGRSARVVRCAEAETLGINSRAELVAAEATFQARARSQALENGVIMTAPDTVFFSHDTVIAPDAVVEPNVVFASGVTIATDATIRAFSHLEGCNVGPGAVVGPYARLRPGATLDGGAKVGNFVEIKNATLGEGAKVNHLTYIGDAEVGARANVGAGTVTCNYDGVFKHRTTIGADAFIGSSTMLVAPVSVGAEAMTASGSVITRDVPEGALAVGRSRQENKQGFAKRMFEKLKNLKKNQAKGA